jgi:hypothetical protein
MKKGLVFLLFLVVFSLPSLSWSRNVSVVLRSGDVVKGKLLGSGEKGVFVQATGGKAKYYKTYEIEEVFDADTNENLTEELVKNGGTVKENNAASDVNQQAGQETTEETAPEETPVKIRRQNNYRAKTSVARVQRGPKPFKPGLVFGMDFTTGSRASNSQLTKAWKETIYNDIEYENADYTKLPLTDFGFELSYKFNPYISLGVFGQWYWLSLGTSQSYTRSFTWYGYTYAEENCNFDMSMGAVTGGAMIRVKPAPKSPVAFSFYAGELALAGASFTMSLDGEKVVEQNFTGSAPYFRGDIEFALTPDPNDVTPILYIGYQSCTVKTIKSEMITGTDVTGPTLKDSTGRNIEADYSSLRIGFKVVGKF